jgi:predicted P-loop ATPase
MATTISNMALLKDYIEQKWEFRKDLITWEIFFRTKNGISWGYWQVLEEENMNDICLEMLIAGYKISKANLEMLVFSSFTKKFNPMLEYLEGLKEYDPINDADYLAHLAGCFLFENDEEKLRFYHHIKKHLVRMIRCSLESNYFNKQGLIISGKQNDGKTRFIRWLMPLGERYIKENPETTKDGKIEFCRNLLVNFDEMAAFNRADMEAMKAIFSQSHSNERPPFGKKNVLMKRHASIFGSSNFMEFLADSSGSARFICFVILGIYHPANQGPSGQDYEKVGIDNIYRQAYYYYKSKFQSELGKDELLQNEKINSRHFIRSDAMNLIQKYFEPGADFMTSSDVNNFILGKIGRGGVQLNPVGTGKILAMLGYNRMQKRNDDIPIYGWGVKELSIDYEPTARGTAAEIPVENFPAANEVPF